MKYGKFRTLLAAIVGIALLVAACGGDATGGLIDATIYVKYDYSSAEDTEVEGKERVGGFIGQTDSGTVENVFTKNVRVSGRTRVGGLIRHNTSKVDETKAENATIDGNSELGGLIGVTQDSELEANLVEGATIEATGDNSGGLVGQNWGEIKKAV